MPRKATGILDQQPDAAREAIFAHCEGCTLDAGVKWLKAEWGIELERSALGDWLKKVRAEKDFAARLSDLALANQRAGVLAQEVGNALQLSNANILLLNQALLDAQFAKDAKAMKHAAIPLTMLIEAVAKAKKADADVLGAETMRDKFQFDAAKAALAHAAELQEINRSKGSEREKIERAKLRLFGEKPAGLKVGREAVEA